MSKRGILILLAVLACSASVCVPAHAQTSLGAIEGTVTGEDGKPVAGAEIHIVNLDMGGKWDVKTNKKGHYYCGGLAKQNIHSVTLTINGQKRATAQVKIGQDARARRSRARVGGFADVVDFNLQGFANQRRAQEAGMQVGESGKLTQGQRREIEQRLEKKRAEREKMEKLNQAFGDGVEALSAGNYEVAIAQLKEAAQLGPEQSAVFASLGEAYLKAGSSKRGTEARALFQKSVAAHEKAMALSPDDLAHRVRLGMALAYAGEFQRAEEELSKCAELDLANGATYMYNLGVLLINDARREDAIKAFRKATKLDPSYPKAWYQLGLCLFPAAKVDETGKSIPAPGTVEALKKYIELRPDGPNASVAQSMIDSFGATVETEYKAGKKKKR